MNNLIMRLLIIVLISCITNIAFACSMSEPDTLSKVAADSLAFNLLQLEYASYKAENKSDKYNALVQKVRLRMRCHQYKEALQEIKRIEGIEKNILQREFFYIEMRNLFFRHGLYNACIDFIEKDSAVQFSAERSFMKSLCLNMQDRYSDLKDELKAVAILMKKDTTDIFNKLHNAGMIKKNKSVLMQAILPGLGMIKEGEVGEGLTSFLLNGIFIAAPIALISQKLYLTSFTYGFFPLTKFYPGSIRHTKYLVQINEEEKLKSMRSKNAALLFEFYNAN